MDQLKELWEDLSDGAKLYVLRVVTSPANAGKDVYKLVMSALAERGAE